jgi:predicted DNA-binding protein (MmcQ/YjbR family)
VVGALVADMDKKHWITAAGGPGLDEDLVKELVAGA